MNPKRRSIGKRIGLSKCLFRGVLIRLRRLAGDFFLACIGVSEYLYLKLRPSLWNEIVAPDFFIAGAQKSGTTSLVDWLNQLSKFRVGVIKVSYKKKLRREIQFFNNPAVRIRGLRWYTSRFMHGYINGEKSPEYIYRRAALREIRRFFPRSKLVVILRNPVDRAFSAYSHYMRGYPRSHYWDWLLPGESFSANLRAEFRTGISFGFLARGRYSEQLEYLYRLFPRGNVKIIVFERLTADPVGSLQEIVDFLGGGEIKSGIDLTAVNVGRYTSRMDDPTRLWLNEYFRPFNERLFDLLGYRISEWEERL